MAAQVAGFFPQKNRGAKVNQLTNSIPGVVVLGLLTSGAYFVGNDTPETPVQPAQPAVVQPLIEPPPVVDPVMYNQAKAEIIGEVRKIRTDISGDFRELNNNLAALVSAIRTQPIHPSPPAEPIKQVVVSQPTCAVPLRNVRSDIKTLRSMRTSRVRPMETVVIEEFIVPPVTYRVPPPPIFGVPFMRPLAGGP